MILIISYIELLMVYQLSGLFAKLLLAKPARCHHGILSAVISQRHSHGFVIFPN